MLISALSQSYVILPECIHRVEHMIILDDSFPSQKNRSNGTTRKMWLKGPGMTSDPPHTKVTMVLQLLPWRVELLDLLDSWRIYIYICNYIYVHVHIILSCVYMIYIYIIYIYL